MLIIYVQEAVKNFKFELNGKGYVQYFHVF